MKAEKFISFLESLETSGNQKLIETIRDAYVLTHKVDVQLEASINRGGRYDPAPKTTFGGGLVGILEKVHDAIADEGDRIFDGSIMRMIRAFKNEDMKGLSAAFNDFELSLADSDSPSYGSRGWSFAKNALSKIRPFV